MVARRKHVIRLLCTHCCANHWCLLCCATPARSLCPTFSAVAMFIDNARWDGVPFLLKAGKALHSKRAEIRVQFRHVPGNLYKGKLGADLDNATNELVCNALCPHQRRDGRQNLYVALCCSMYRADHVSTGIDSAGARLQLIVRRTAMPALRMHHRLRTELQGYCIQCCR